MPVGVADYRTRKCGTASAAWRPRRFMDARHRQAGLFGVAFAGPALLPMHLTAMPRAGARRRGARSSRGFYAPPGGSLSARSNATPAVDLHLFSWRSDGVAGPGRHCWL